MNVLSYEGIGSKKHEENLYLYHSIKPKAGSARNPNSLHASDNLSFVDVNKFQGTNADVV